MDKRSKSLLLALGAVIGGLACDWTQEDADAWVNSLVAGCIVGAVFALIAVVAGSLPLCCGLMKPQGKIIAAVVIAVGIFICFVPLIAAKASADQGVTKMCDHCEAADCTTGWNNQRCTSCTDDDRAKAKEAVTALGALVAYLLAYGWLCVILGITASGIGCCILCKCCKMKDEVVFAGGGAPQAQVMGQVVGAPVSEENKA